MVKGKLICFEGGDASGKNTQAKLLLERLVKEGYPTKRDSFPMYNTPTGKIVGGPLLGKPEISNGYFPEGAANVPKEVALLYYLADRVYNKPFIEKTLASGENLILDRYVESSMGHQGGKIRNFIERNQFYNFLGHLEYELFGLPRPDLTVFLYMPFEKAIELKSGMNVEKDEVEKDYDYLKNSEESYLQLANHSKWKKIDCLENEKLRPVEEIHEEVYSIVRKILN